MRAGRHGVGGRRRPLPSVRAFGLLPILALSCGDPSPQNHEEIREFVFEAPPSAGPSTSPLEASAPLFDAVEALQAAADDTSCKGIFVRVGGLGGAWGAAADLGLGMDAVREAGKPVHCHFDATDNVGYSLMAAHCDHISMTPAGVALVVGVALQVVYMRTLLDTIGVQADILHMGRYKGAGDMFTETEMPETARESLGDLLDDFNAALTAALRTRELDAEAVTAGGPYTSVSALEAGLIDDILYRRAAAAPLLREVPGDSLVRAFPPEADEEFDLAALLLSGSDEAAARQDPRIAVVHVTGNIVDGTRSRAGQAASGPFVEAMRTFTEDDGVKAIVLRIDSPGGSALASDLMWQAVREAQEKKPVIASVGNMAASGGYYIASAANVIIAHETSIVGSIGVVGGKMSVAQMADRIGLNAVTLSRSPRATLLSPLSPFSEDQADAFQGMLRSTYYRFVRRVAEGRGATQEEILEAAEGRVMSGRQGLERGLVDRFGGLQAALAEAREQADFEGELATETWPAPGGAFAALADAIGAEASITERAAQLTPMADWLWLPIQLEQQPILSALPFSLEVQ